LEYQKNDIDDAVKAFDRLATMPLWYEGKEIERKYMRRSGSPLTSFGNTINSMVSSVIAFNPDILACSNKTARRYFKNYETLKLKVMAQGDDTLNGTGNPSQIIGYKKENLDLERLSKYYARYGLSAKIKVSKSDVLEAAKEGNPIYFLGGFFVPVVRGNVQTLLHVNKPMQIFNQGGVYSGGSIVSPVEHFTWLSCLAIRYGTLARFPYFKELANWFINRTKELASKLEGVKINVELKEYLLRKWGISEMGDYFEITQDTDKVFQLLYGPELKIKPLVIAEQNMFTSRDLYDLSVKESKYAC